MEYFWDQAPSVDCGLGLASQVAQALQEISAVFVFHEDPPTFDPAGDDVMQDPRGIQPWATRHART